MLERVLAHSIQKLAPLHEELLRLDRNVLNESLENLEKDVIAHGEGGLEHLVLGSSGSQWQRMVLNERVGEDAHLENDVLDVVIKAVQLIKLVLITSEVRR